MEFKFFPNIKAPARLVFACKEFLADVKKSSRHNALSAEQPNLQVSEGI